MGVTISTHSGVSPLALASTTAGFISFAFTIATFLRVTWENYATFRHAHRQIDTHLGNLKQGLYEERAHLRRAARFRRRHRPSTSTSTSTNGCEASLKEAGAAERGYAGYSGNHGRDGAADDDDVTARVMRATVRNMLREFWVLEKPFLRDEDGGGKRRGSSSRRDANARNGEGGQDDTAALSDEDDDDDSEEECAYHTAYRECGLRERILWMRSKADVVLLLQRLGRLETRRIAKEVGEAALYVPLYLYCYPFPHAAARQSSTVPGE
ncbi:uncharacterized protein K452DRAFT_289387 [Aplosporella prunicola CBS 121167]|uniref:Uncharacterized protein n=1 Tax=Aplosporella prunicola CBS 121167 TaxID=1176127 RepID=A0A6A6B9K6_9PEZI|nr:uncharacterized protein K452DRAFT_289387 [Aplosporella prunicola CBS 121167]KAF2139995.1 hypothetical protein K452DRAFT_289387 [Aplosporella prunicola CBS 121167]